ncbi:MAG: CBS domain-containing protein [Acidobacteria bacterium]|nr:CBS domain-containing protein [Acidobacteriota bacterium]
MIVSMWMSRNILTVTPDTAITDAATLMMNNRIRRLPVVTRQPAGLTLQGIVSNTDLFRAFPSEINPLSVVAADAFKTDLQVKDVMHHHPVTTTPDAPIEVAARIMRDQKISALPVLQNNLLVGLITESDIFRAFVEMFESRPNEVRITFDASKNEDTLEAVVTIAGRHNVRIVSLITTEHEERHLCVIRVTGQGIEKFQQELWRSGHPVLNIIRTP